VHKDKQLAKDAHQAMKEHRYSEAIALLRQMEYSAIATKMELLVIEHELATKEKRQ
jgi:hypothetical protein